MWFKMPPGVDRVQVSQQDFEAEVRHETGHYFRAPDHFAPTILGLGKFKVEEPSDTDLSDLPERPESHDEAMEALARELASMQDQLRTANEANSTLTAQLTSMTSDRDQMKMAGADAAGKLADAEGELNALKLALTDKGVDPKTLLPAVDPDAAAKAAAEAAKGKK